MILFDPLYDTIVTKLTQHKGATTQDLYTYVSAESTISLPSFYRVIGKLLDEQIVIKENGKLFLHSRWILGLLDLADGLKQVYFSDVWSVEQLQEGQAMYYEATSIEAIDGVQGDRMLSVNRLYGKQEPTYTYQARPYYALGMNKTEMAYRKEVHKIAEVYFLAGNTNFLDLYGTSLYTEIGVKALATDTVPFLKDGYCIAAIGDYVFEVLYPKEINNYFKIFFDTIKDLKDFNPDNFHTIFTMKASCKLTLRRDRQQAESVREVFQKAFAGV